MSPHLDIKRMIRTSKRACAFISLYGNSMVNFCSDSSRDFTSLYSSHLDDVFIYIHVSFRPSV